MASKVIGKFFWYTINTHTPLFKDANKNINKDIYPDWPGNSNPKPAAITLQNFISQYPQWRSVPMIAPSPISSP